MKNVISVLLLSLAIGSQAPAQVSQDSIRSFLRSALDLMQENSVKSGQVDWDKLYQDVLSREVRTMADAYALVDTALATLDDGHSFFWNPQKGNNWGGEGASYPESTLKARMIDDTIGYLRVPSIGGQGIEAVQAEGSKLRDAVCEILRNDPSAIVVDLTRNYGGNMYPMLLGLAPVIGDGICGYFSRKGGSQSAWILQRDSLFFNENYIAHLSEAAQCTVPEEVKIAVLINEYTISSGEAVAVAFKGKPNVRFLGSATTGATTANMTYNLDASSMLFLAVAVYADRTGQRYLGKIEPDVYVTCPDCPVEEFDAAALQAARAWFKR